MSLSPLLHASPAIQVHGPAIQVHGFVAMGAFALGGASRGSEGNPAGARHRLDLS
jgi:hypothetical protein